jgi:hypothetical protein
MLNIFILSVVMMSVVAPILGVKIRRMLHWDRLSAYSLIIDKGGEAF